MENPQAPQPPLSFETHPSRYRHIKLSVDGPVARIALDVQENGGLRPDYALKLNSYDMSVDIELFDAVTRLRFEHPEVACVVITSALEGCFCAGANIFMLGSSSHAFKVNFCKYTNETRLAIEDATRNSGQTYVAALNGIASGGGYELPLACQEIYLVDDRRSAVALPELPYLGVLPGTGGLTRVVDKRKVRRDLADWFSTLAEGVKGKRAVEWGLVDKVFPPTQFAQAVDKRAREIAGAGHPERKGVTLEALEPQTDGQTVSYRHVTLRLGPVARTAHIEIAGPTASDAQLPEDPTTLGAGWYPLRVFRELDDILLRLRFNHPEVGLVLLHTRGNAAAVTALDDAMTSRRDHWFVHETRLLVARVLKRLDLTAKSFFALVEPGSCWAGTLFEVALAADRSFMREDDSVAIGLNGVNAGTYPMSNGLTRIETRFLADPGPVLGMARESRVLSTSEAVEAGLVTVSYDDLDWDDEIRLATEERISLSPDGLTGMEANLRFAGPETMETKIFGRLSAWQNWIFQRPNAVGERGALTLYGQPESPQFDWRRT